MARHGNLRARIEALNRGPLAEPPRVDGGPATELDPGDTDRTTVAVAGSLDDVIPGRVVRSTSGRSAYLIETPVALLDPDAGEVMARYEAAFGDVAARVQGRWGLDAVDAGLRPEDLVYLDIETTGLSPTGPAFLAGVMVFDGGEWNVRQFLARDEEEEAGVLDLCADVLASGQALVSFNGVQFDVPYLQSRAGKLGVRFGVPSCHLDLLVESRRTWRRDVPNCKLQTLESRICGRTRSGDIPGHRIPAAYRAFLRSGDTRDMKAIVYHNALDLFTLADLLTRLVSAHERRSSTSIPAARSRIRQDHR